MNLSVKCFVMGLCLVLSADAPGALADDFTIIIVPDTQHYSENHPEIYSAQMQWIVDQKETRNIVFVGHLGDIVNRAGQGIQWQHADAAHSLLEDPVTTGLADGIPYGLCVGNHDQDPGSNPGTFTHADVTTVLYNQYFGVNRFLDRSYYGGHYGTNNDNHYILFEANDTGFIVVCMEYNPGDTELRKEVLTWADCLFQTYNDRRAIVLTHFPLNAAGEFTGQGSAIYDSLSRHANFFLLMGGHQDEAARRSDPVGPTLEEGTLTSIMSDYQFNPDGGNGWLRIMTFETDDDGGIIDVKTYSPWLDEYKPDMPPPEDFDAHNFIIEYDIAVIPGEVRALDCVTMNAGGSFNDTPIIHGGYIDPRIESSQGSEPNMGLDSAVLVFNEPVFGIGGGELQPGDFSVTQTGVGDAPSVLHVNTTDNIVVEIILDRIITLQEWTTITAIVEDAMGNTLLDANSVDIGFLPGDIDQDGHVGPFDVLRFRLILGNVFAPERGMREDYADVDRDGWIGPFDLLRFRQLAVGAPPATQSWRGQVMNSPRP